MGQTASTIILGGRSRSGNLRVVREQAPHEGATTPSKRSKPTKNIHDRLTPISLFPPPTRRKLLEKGGSGCKTATVENPHAGRQETRQLCPRGHSTTAGEGGTHQSSNPRSNQNRPPHNSRNPPTRTSPPAEGEQPVQRPNKATFPKKKKPSRHTRRGSTGGIHGFGHTPRSNTNPRQRELTPIPPKRGSSLEPHTLFKAKGKCDPKTGKCSVAVGGTDGVFNMGEERETQDSNIARRERRPKWNQNAHSNKHRHNTHQGDSKHNSRQPHNPLERGGRHRDTRSTIIDDFFNKRVRAIELRKGIARQKKYTDVPDRGNEIKKGGATNERDWYGAVEYQKIDVYQKGGLLRKIDEKLNLLDSIDELGLPLGDKQIGGILPTLGQRFNVYDFGRSGLAGFSHFGRVILDDGMVMKNYIAETFNGDQSGQVLANRPLDTLALTADLSISGMLDLEMDEGKAPVPAGCRLTVRFNSRKDKKVFEEIFRSILTSYYLLINQVETREDRTPHIFHGRRKGSLDRYERKSNKGGSSHTRRLLGFWEVINGMIDKKGVATIKGRIEALIETGIRTGRTTGQIWGKKHSTDQDTVRGIITQWNSKLKKGEKSTRFIDAGDHGNMWNQFLTLHREIRTRLDAVELARVKGIADMADRGGKSEVVEEDEVKSRHPRKRGGQQKANMTDVNTIISISLGAVDRSNDDGTKINPVVISHKSSTPNKLVLISNKNSTVSTPPTLLATIQNQKGAQVIRDELTKTLNKTKNQVRNNILDASQTMNAVALSAFMGSLTSAFGETGAGFIAPLLMLGGAGALIFITNKLGK